MISPAFFAASIVGFHVEFSQSTYVSKWPYSTCTYCMSVTGPSVYWGTSWARALSESEEAARHGAARHEAARHEAARHMDKIVVLVIFSSPVAIYVRSADTRINPPCPACSALDIGCLRNIHQVHYNHDDIAISVESSHRRCERCRLALSDSSALPR